MERHITEILEAIQTKEVQLKSLSVKPDDCMQTQFRSLKADRHASIEHRRKIDSDLKALTAEILKKKDALSKIKIGLPYKSENRVDETIRRLDYELKNRNFKLSEEKKIVAEIDGLKRSKKSFGKCNIMEAELSDLKESQRRLRQEGEFYFKKVSSLKSQEEDLKKKMSAALIQIEVLKREIDELHDDKRVLISELKKQEQKRSENRKRHQQESMKKREKQRQEKQSKWRKEKAELAALREPYDEERHLCATLVTYLHRYLSVTSPDHEPELSPRSPRETAPPDVAQDGMYVLKRKSDDADNIPLYGGTALVRRTSSKKLRKERRKTLPKIIAHTPETLAQFAELNLTAPSCPAEVSISIEHLEARKRYYVQQAQEMSNANNLNSPVAAPVSETSSLSIDDMYDFDIDDDDGESTPSLGRSLDPDEARRCMYFRNTVVSSSTDSSDQTTSCDAESQTEDCKPLPGESVTPGNVCGGNDVNRKLSVDFTRRLKLDSSLLNIPAGGDYQRKNQNRDQSDIEYDAEFTVSPSVANDNNNTSLSLNTSLKTSTETFQAHCEPADHATCWRCNSSDTTGCSNCRPVLPPDNEQFQTDDNICNTAPSRGNDGQPPAIITTTIPTDADDIHFPTFLLPVDGSSDDDDDNDEKDLDSGAVDYIDIDGGNTSSNPESPLVMSDTPPRFMSAPRFMSLNRNNQKINTAAETVSPPFVVDPDIS